MTAELLIKRPSKFAQSRTLGMILECVLRQCLTNARTRSVTAGSGVVMKEATFPANSMRASPSPCRIVANKMIPWSGIMCTDGITVSYFLHILFLTDSKGYITQHQVQLQLV